MDVSLESLFETLLGLLLRAHAADRIPFIWFWPEAFQSCIVMTHDVETSRGLRYCSRLMDLDERHGLRLLSDSCQRTGAPFARFPPDHARAGFEINDVLRPEPRRPSVQRQQSFVERSDLSPLREPVWSGGISLGSLGTVNPTGSRTLTSSTQATCQSQTAGIWTQQGGCCSVTPFSWAPCWNYRSRRPGLFVVPHIERLFNRHLETAG